MSEKEYMPQIDLTKQVMRQKSVSKIGNVFSGKTFCIEKSGFTPEDADDLETIIMNNGGNVIDASIERSLATHMIHNDGGQMVPTGKSLSERLDKGENGKFNVS